MHVSSETSNATELVQTISTWQWRDTGLDGGDHGARYGFPREARDFDFKRKLLFKMLANN